MGDVATDTELVERARGGDGRAFRELVERHESSVALTVTGMLGASAEVDDAVQEVFIRFYHSLADFRGDSRLDTYLNRIAINRCIDIIRRRKRMRARQASLEEARVVTGEDEQDAAERREARRLVRKAVDELPPKFRSVVVLRMIRGYSTEETATILDLPYGTVLSRLSRAHEKLHAALAPLVDQDAGDTRSRGKC